MLIYDFYQLYNFLEWFGVLLIAKILSNFVRQVKFIKKLLNGEFFLRVPLNPALDIHHHR